MAGSSRFLNTIYATDLTVSGETSFAGITATGLTVNGAATVTGTLTLTKTTDLSGTANNSPALIIGGAATATHIEIDANEIQGKATGTTTGEIFINNDGGKVNLSKSGKIYANDGTLRTQTLEVNGSTYYFNSSGNINANGITATSATIGTANITTGKAADFEITGTLRTYEHDIDHVANLGGNFLVTPTINFLDGTVSITSLTKSGNVITATIKDASTLGNTAGVTSIGNVDWLKNAKIKIAGQIGGVVLGTCDGKLEANLNATAGTMTVSFTYTGNRLADIPTAGTAITDIKGLTVMLTETVATSGASTSHKIGIYMTARDSNNYSHISMYNGVSDDPTVRIGNLSGLDPVNGFDPDDLDDRWGIYTSNGFFKGIIISEEGKIGGWFLGSDAIYSSSKTFAAANNMYFGASGISLGTTFKVTDAGELTSTSGNIAAFQIDATALHTANVAITSNADNSIALSHADFTRTVAGASRTGLRFAIGDKFGVTGDGILYGSSVNLTGAINATSGTIGSNATSGNRWQIGDKAIYNTTNSMTSTGVGTYVGVDGIRNYKDANTYVNIQDGVITAKAVNLTGAITATSLTLSQGVTIGQDKIDGLTDDLSDLQSTADAALGQSVWYADCDTVATTAEKVATISPTTTAFTLNPGATVNVKFTHTNSASVSTIKLNVNSTGAKNIKYIYNGALENLPKANYLRAGQMYQFRYDGTYWVVELVYNTNDNTYDRTSYNQAVKAASAGYVGTHIICGTDAGYVNIGANVTFDLSYPILYYATAAATTIASGSTANNHYLNIPGIKFSTNGTITSGTAYKQIYLKGTMSTGNLFTIAASPFMTTVTPTTEDGYYYIPLGIMSSATNGRFVSSNQLYAYKDGAFGPVSIREASAAAKTATNYLTTITGTTGISVHDVGDTSNFVNMNSNGVFVYKGGTQRAQFGETTIIGKPYDSTSSSNEHHVEIGYHSFKLVDDSNNEYVFFSDTRDRSGISTIKETYFRGPNDSKTITPGHNIIQVVSLKKTPNGGGAESDVAYTMNGQDIVISDGQITSYCYIELIYTSNDSIKAFTFGTRFNTGYIGDNSFSCGVNNIASGSLSFAIGNNCHAEGRGSYAEGEITNSTGKFSHSEGHSTMATGDYSHAEGTNVLIEEVEDGYIAVGTWASGEASHAEGKGTYAEGDGSHSEGCLTESYGNNSHAEGNKTQAIGDDSHAQNLGTIAAKNGQTAIGYYNIKDTSLEQDFILIIGNGYENARSNALTVDMLGEVALDLDVDSSASSSTAATSGTDMDLFNAIRSLGWYDDVIS